ncbi:MAG: YqcC family protein, partial [Gammaproteobacteria bacterium]
MFHQWLQWQFLPRMSAALDGHELWPSDSAIYPYAEECLAGRAGDVRELLFLIETLDELICGAGATPLVSGNRH